ncbi:hypothetical protein, variant 3 [Aphanomyces astaci]|uniref:Uncharacterized protein n=1 Tax=Aphanomyces astaci TaxID=112090 RepID=W4GDX0_APHAT|nr:hypothetical protein, variant 3 [Aphanomyces astaci]ETV77870.1 hypothetical protein, variant 3 [Aphanomyces astaci]|eukprot:XP_009832990.1 hypothetical protein, variant 3 [Aphanomyces astaci]
MMLGDPFDMAPLRNRVFCTFMDCATCGQFFRDAYTRNYKPNGVKVLRCFPHCCPDHVPHSSCGTSVVMQVAGQYSAAEAHSFVAFGRFETCSEPTFSLGHQLHLDDMQVSCSATNSLAMWFPSDSPSDENPRTFTFKEKQHTPWHYGWTSGASAALRNTQHVFKGYLFHVMAESPNVLQLVGIAQSPGFIIVPYKPLGHEAVDTVPPDSISVDIIDVAPASSAFDCHFVSCQCEKPMFGDNYIRCNRANGRKQLRCFPHCCPEHILHCSCGGPIMCGVNLSLAPPLARPAKELVMYAHGERFNMPELHLHDELPHDLILSRLHQPGNERGDWVKGVVQPGISTPVRPLPSPSLATQAHVVIMFGCRRRCCSTSTKTRGKRDGRTIGRAARPRWTATVNTCSRHMCFKCCGAATRCAWSTGSRPRRSPCRRFDGATRRRLLEPTRTLK